MKLKTLSLATLGLVAVLIAQCGEQPSAGNNQPDGGKLEQCAMPGEINIDPVAYILADGQKYSAGAYLMDGECDPVDTSGDPLMKITLVAIDSRGSRMDPKLNSAPKASPFGAVVLFPLPTHYSLELVATGNMGKDEVRAHEVLFIGCALIPFGDSKLAVSTNLVDIGGGKGKVECRIAK